MPLHFPMPLLSLEVVRVSLTLILPAFLKFVSLSVGLAEESIPAFLFASWWCVSHVFDSRIGLCFRGLANQIAD